MTQPQVAPYGAWESPISADLISTEGRRIIEAVADGEDIYWIEMRPTESGRYVIVRRTPDGQTTDVTPSPFNARTRVHEYGGAAFVVCDGTIYFSNLPINASTVNLPAQIHSRLRLKGNSVMQTVLLIPNGNA